LLIIQIIAHLVRLSGNVLVIEKSALAMLDRIK